MADKKISALTASTTPLGGTEVLPIVQGGSTVKVSVANLTAGRDTSVKDLNASGNVVSKGTAIFFGDGLDNSAYVYATGGPVHIFANAAATFDFTTAGNLKPLIADRGIDFSVNSNAPGMSSEVLSDYEEGTWTPTIAFGGASVGVTYASQAGTYTKIGRQVILNFDVRLSNKGSSAGVWQISNFPFTAGFEGNGGLHFQSGNATINDLAAIRITGGSAFGELYYAGAGSTLGYADSDATNSSICIGQVIYFV
jgi:hypothetical protein